MPSNVRGGDNFDSGEVIGQNQTWQDLTASRSAGVTYTNTSGRPIMINITPQGSTTTCNITIDGVIVAEMLRSVDYEATLSAIVPNGSTYLYTHGLAPLRWVELR